MTPSPNPLPQGGEGFIILSPLPVGEGWVRALFPYYFVFPYFSPISVRKTGVRLASQ
jgi:hypothetical protein